MTDELTLRACADLALKPAFSTPPATVGELAARIAAYYPAEDGESWDTYGLSVGDPDAAIGSVAIALDATVSAVRAAKFSGANVLVTHHPAFLEPPAQIMPFAHGTSGGLVWEAVREGVAVMSFHTALDASIAAGTMLPDMLNLLPIAVMKPLVAEPAKGYGRISTCKADDPQTLETLAARATAVFGRQPRVWGDFTASLSRIGTWGGSIGHCLEETDYARMDCLVCGEIGYHTALSLAEAGIGVIELGHDVSEFPLSLLLRQTVLSCGLAPEAVVMLDRGARWAYPETVRV